MSTPIPLDTSEVTAEWLSAALSSTGTDTEVASVTELDRHDGTTGRLRLGLTYAANSSGPESVFVKLAPFSERQRKLVARTGMGEREARFYAGPAAEVAMRIPGAYYAAHGDDPTQYVMVLEDLAAAGVRFTSRLDPLDGAQVESLIVGLAGVHARFWNDPAFDDGELSWVPIAMRGSYGATLIASAKEQYAADMPPHFAALCDLYVEHHEAITDLWDEGEQTLIHGDTHAGNTFVDDGRVGLYDWAVVSRSPGIRDVAIHVGNSVAPEVRREGLDNWLRAYHDTLEGAGVEVAPYDTMVDRFRRCVLYAWTAAATTLAMGSAWQPVEVGMAGTRQATAACEELDTIGAIRDAL